MQKKRRRSNPFRVILLLLAIAAVIYFDRMVIPTIPEFFQPTRTPTRAAESISSDAKGLEGEGKYSQAIIAYKDAVAGRSAQPAELYLTRAAQYLLRNFEEAITDAENAILLNPNNDEALALRGWAIGLSGDYVRRFAALEEVIK